MDGGLRVNIFIRELYKKLGYNKIKSAPFTIKMVNQKKMNLIGIIKDLHI